MNQIKVELQGYMASDKIIAEAAWTSSTELQAKELKTPEQIAGLVEQLAEEGHGVPFEHCIFRFWIKNAIALDRQLVKHRIASHSGMSGRYRQMPSEYLDISDDIMEIIDKMPKTERVETRSGIIFGYGDLVENYYESCEKANHNYKFGMAIAKKAKEDKIISNEEYKRFREFYRGQLPQHNMTETVFTINLRSLANLFKLRLSSNAQKEIREVAEQMYNLIKTSNCIPVAMEVLEKNNWNI